jgi:predicted TIM-barrel fold metal-dependent hydrolase
MLTAHGIAAAALVFGGIVALNESAGAQPSREELREQFLAECRNQFGGPRSQGQDISPLVRQCVQQKMMGAPTTGRVPEAGSGQKAAMSPNELRPSPLPWIDVHMHLVPARGADGPDFSGSVQAALDLMGRTGIEFAVLMPTPQSPARYDETAFAPLLRRYPKRFAYLGGGGELNAMIHSTDPARVSEDARRRFVAKAERILRNGARGFGEMAILHLALTANHPFEQTRADHPLFLALAQVAGRHGAVIDMHIDLVPAEAPTPGALREFGNPRSLRPNVTDFERLLAHDRRARFILEHAGADPLGFATTELIGRLLDANPNLYVAIRGAPAVASKMQNKLVDFSGLLQSWSELLTRHADRFLFGTDSFLVSPTAGDKGPGAFFAQRNVGKLIFHNRLLAMLPPEVARKIAQDNPRRLFGLEGR